MVLDPYSAAQFIQGYKTLLLEIDAQVSRNGARRVLEKLVAAREQLCKDRSLLKEALDRVKVKNLDISSAVIQAVEDLQIEQCGYTCETRSIIRFLSTPKAIPRSVSLDSPILFETLLVVPA